MAKYLPSVTVRRIILCLLAASPPFGLAEESQTSAPNRHHDKNISSISNKIRFLAIGDWGGTPHYPYSTHGQLKTARGMARVAAASSSPAAMNHDVDHDPSASFVLALGDNFYRSGVDEKDVDIRFNETFEKVYGQEELQIPWYVCGGNHDHRGDITQQVLLSQSEGTRWHFPDLNHRVVKEFTVRSPTKTADAETFHTSTVKIEIIMIDTIHLAGFHDAETELLYGEFHPLPGPSSSLQASMTLSWIESALQKSDADYLLVAGHYPVYSPCRHGNTQDLIENLDPLLKQHGVTAYLSGHDHCQFHYQHDSMDYILTGAGMNCCYNATMKEFLPEGGELKYIWEDYTSSHGDTGGFASFEVGKEEMKVIIHDQDGGKLYETVLLPRTEHQKSGVYKEVSL